MSRLRALLSEIARRGDAPCLIHRGAVESYGSLAARCREWCRELDARGVLPGAVVAIRSDYSPDGVALLLALLSRGNVAAMLPAAGNIDRMLDDASASLVARAGEADAWTFEDRPASASHPLLDRLRESGSGGFVIYSSGSTGPAKAVLHDIERFLVKYDRPGKQLRTLAFLLFDHIAGMDTLFYSLAAGGSLVIPEHRDPHRVCGLVESHHVQVLPTSPSFLRLMLLAGAHENRDLSSLEIITYGSEPMDPTTLARIGEAFPHAEIVQKYGTSELGSPRSRSRDRSSLWLHLKEGEVEMRVEEGILWLRSPAAMLGYLNAPTPMDADGWYCTGDRVERDGDWIRVLGRDSDLINVGGEKVFPQEVEEVILELAWVRDVVVSGCAHPLLGQAVYAEVELEGAEGIENPGREIRRHCRERLPRHKVPLKVTQAKSPITSSRQKKMRGRTR